MINLLDNHQLVAQIQLHITTFSNMEQVGLTSRIRSTLGGWRELIEKRSLQTNEDCRLRSEYTSSLSCLSFFLSAFEKGAFSKQNVRVFIVLACDERNVIQALGTATIESKHLQVRTLMTAPWNLRLSAPLSQLQRPYQIRRAGTCVLSEMYKIAVREQMLEIRLQSLTNCYSYYKEKIGMQETGNRSELHLPVTNPALKVIGVENLAPSIGS